MTQYYAKTKNNIIVQIQPYYESGYYKVSNNAIAGYAFLNGELIPPPSPQSKWDGKQWIEKTSTKEELIAHAEEQFSRTQTPITIKGYTFIPNEKTCNRMNNKIQILRKKDDPDARVTWLCQNGNFELSLDQLENMAIAADNQWQPYFDFIARVTPKIKSGEIVTKEQVEAEYDAD